jgi:hypothetical protein
MAKGLDCGTSYYIAATEDAIKKQRNVFLTVDGDANQVKRMLKRQKIPFVEKAGKVHIVGQHAFNYAQIFSQTELKRPMSSGLLNPKERDALPVLNAIIGELLGKSKGKETCVYCIPAKPIDQVREVSYHEDVLKQIIETYGYDVKVIEESVALAYEGLVDNDLTGIAISMGAGMCNICVMYNNAESVPNFPDSIPIVFGGGTSLVKGFLQVVGEQFNQDEFPIQISDIKLVEDAHTAVARGCLSEAELIEEEDGE